LITYNLEDCPALKRVSEFLCTLCAKPQGSRILISTSE